MTTAATWLASVLLGIVLARIVIIVCRRASTEQNLHLRRSKPHRAPLPFPPSNWRL